MRKWFVCVIAIGLGALSGGCSYTMIDEHLIPTAYVEEGENAGYLVGSIGSYIGGAPAPPDSSALRFKRAENDEIGVISVSIGLWPHGDYVESDRAGMVFAIPLKPGEYEIVNVSFFYQSYSPLLPSERYEGDVEFSAPFSIRENEVHYMGEFLAFADSEAGILGLPMRVRGHFVHSENLDRDRPLLLSKYPELTHKPFRSLRLRMEFPPWVREIEAESASLFLRDRR